MRSIKLFGWLGLLFAVSSIVSFIGFSGNVSAVSPYDDIYIPTDKLFVGSNRYGMSCEPEEITNSYKFILEDKDNWANEDNYNLYKEEFNEDVSYYISNSNLHGGNLDNYYYQVHINYSYNEQIKLNWNNPTDYQISPYLEEDPYSVGSITINVNSSCNYQVSSSTAFNGVVSYSPPAMYGETSANYILNNIDPNYPENYEGTELKFSTPLKENLYPHFTYVVTDKEIKATHDLSQELPELPEPDEGWQNNQWQVMWYLFKCSSIDDDDIIDCPDRESVHSKLLERDEIYTWEVDDYGDYLLTAEFRYQSCLRSPSWPETPDYCYLNSEHDEYSFVPGRTVYLPIDGNNIYGNTADLNCDVAGNCYDDTRFKDCNVIVAIATLSFEEFNYADCLENISLLANMLSFDTIRFSNSWVSNGNCYTLGTLGNWLNLSNKHVCPYFSNEVRNTVTPFITFLLGLIMVKFIAGRGKHGSREVEI